MDGASRDCQIVSYSGVKALFDCPYSVLGTDFSMSELLSSFQQRVVAARVAKTGSRNGHFARLSR